MAVLCLASCMKSDSDGGEPYCAIQAFSVGSIVSYVQTVDADGNNISSKRVVSGSSIYFNIDQKAGTITNVDPLPYWITLTRVLPTFTSYGNVYMVMDSLLWGITSGTDSIDVTVPRTLACISTDGLYRKDYTLTITKRAEVSDTIVWERLSTADLQLTGAHRALVATYKDENQTDLWVRRIFVFSEDEASCPQVTSTVDGQSWTVPAALTGAEGTIDYQSVTIHQGQFYAIDDLGKLYTATEQSKGVAWTKVADTSLQSLLGSDGVYLYGFDGTTIVGTADMVNWKAEGSTDLGMLPQHSVYSFSVPMKSNESLTMAMMGGISSGNTANGVTWYKKTSPEKEYDEPWSYIQVTGDNAHGLPRLEELSTFYYEGQLYTMGRSLQSDGTYRFDGFYCSEDHGIAWHLQEAKWLLPVELDAADGPASTVLVGDTLYVVQQGGSVWRGVIR
ncbi:MAG: hypothetical protein IJT97_02410 [Bacteroidaceae bacterium]|nr:hypothetical protein [Bacteroidaceae bacterium]